MTFANPVFLQIGALLALLVVVGLGSQDRRRKNLFTFLGGERGSRRTAGSDLARKRVERWILLGVATLALAAAAAEPRRLTPPPEEPPPPEIPSIIFAIDVSASMQGTDLVPTRLGRAVEIVSDLIDERPEARIGIVLFAGTAYPLVHPTRDHGALRYLLSGVAATIASAQDPGTLLTAGIGASMDLLLHENTPPGTRTIVLLTDGEAGEGGAAFEAMAREAENEGIHLHAVGMGTAEGSGLVMPRGSFQLGGTVLDPAGRPAHSRLQKTALRNLVEASGGGYADAGDPAGLRELGRRLEPPTAPPTEETPLPPWSRIDPVLWLTSLALVLLLIESLLDVRVVDSRRSVGWQTLKEAS